MGWAHRHKYDALLAANLAPDYPEDRWVSFTRCRAWLLYQGFSQDINLDCLQAFAAPRARRRRSAAPCARRRRRSARLAVHLDRAHPGGEPGRQELEGVAGGDGAGDQGAGHDDALALDEEGAVDRQADGIASRVRRRERARGALRGRRAAPATPCAGQGRDRQDRRAGETGAGQELGELELGELGGLGVDGVDLVERDDEPGQLEELGDLQMLAGLRADPLVGGDDEQQEPHAAEAGERVVQEALVPRDVDEGDRRRSPAPPRSAREVREAEVERDAAPLLLREAVAVDAGERADERGLAVVDVAGGADEKRLIAAPLRSAGRQFDGEDASRAAGCRRRGSCRCGR